MTALINDIKKCSNISVGKSPTYSLKSDVFIFNNVLEAISIVTVDIVSSITNDSMDEYLSIVFLSPIADLNASPKAIATSSMV